MGNVELEREIERVTDELSETRQRRRELGAKASATMDELIELGGLLARERILEKRLRSLLTEKFWPGARNV